MRLKLLNILSVIVCCTILFSVLAILRNYGPEPKENLPIYSDALSVVTSAKLLFPITTNLPTTTAPNYRILCWILTNPPNLEKRTVYIKWTWGPQCDITLYMSTTGDPDFPTIGLNVTEPESKKLNSLKVQRAWLYIYQHYLDQADFFMKADDDTYVVVHNLRAYLATRDPTLPEFYGRRFLLPKKNVTYMSGGGGLVLTNQALALLGEKILTKNLSCIPHGTGEDWKICYCLKLAGAEPVDTRDEKGRERFHSFSLQTHLVGDYPDWFYKYDIDGSVMGDECCSEYPISFHYVRGQSQMTLHYLFYHLRLAKFP